MFYECTGRRNISIEPYLLQNEIDVATQRQAPGRRSRDNQFDPSLFQNQRRNADEESLVTTNEAAHSFTQG